MAAFVWFLFDDSSLGLLIRADVTPSLLDYLDTLTRSEYRQAVELNSSAFLHHQNRHQSHHHHQGEQYPAELTTGVTHSSPERCGFTQHQYNRNTAATSASAAVDIGEYSPQPSSSARSWMLYPSSPESSPYHNHHSPSSSLNYYQNAACSPSSVSLTYSPPHSPPLSPASPPPADEYSDFLNESYGDPGGSHRYGTSLSGCGSKRKKIIPYHFQSADGIHAMIHGTRGPIHDTLLLLSRFSQAKDPGSFFLYLPGFNSLLNHVSLSVKPNPKCARLLNRLTSNSYCFDVLLKKGLIPRLFLRLCTGWSLENLTAILDEARRDFDCRINELVGSTDGDGNHNYSSEKGRGLTGNFHHNLSTSSGKHMKDNISSTLNIQTPLVENTSTTIKDSIFDETSCRSKTECLTVDPNLPAKDPVGNYGDSSTGTTLIKDHGTNNDEKPSMRPSATSPTKKEHDENFATTEAAKTNEAVATTASTKKEHDSKSYTTAATNEVVATTTTAPTTVMITKKEHDSKSYTTAATKDNLETSSTKTTTASNTKDEEEDANNRFCENNHDILFLGDHGVTRECHRIGKLLLSNLQMQGQTTYGSGVLSKILSMGSNQLQETCLVALPYVIW